MAKLRVDPFVPRAWRQSPLFAPLWSAAAEFEEAEAWPEVRAYNDPALPIRFVPLLRRRRAGEPGYEATITEQRAVATRAANWHDFFNMLVWRSFPRAKWALTRRHVAEAAAAPEAVAASRNGRSRALDRLSMIDEGGVVVVAPAAEHPGIADKLRRCGPALADPGLVGATLVIFGHAIYEHLVLGTGPVRGHAILIAREAAPSVAAIDAWLAAALDRGELLGADDRLGVPIRPGSL